MRILTDSTSDIDQSSAKELNIDVIPLHFIIDGKEYKDRIDLNPEQFYELLETSEVLPTTSQPSPQDFLYYFEKAMENNEEIIVMTLSSQLSGTYQSACIAKNIVGYEDIYIIDSLNATQGLRLLVEKAIQLRDINKTVQEIVEILENYKKRIRIFGIVDTLDYFYKGGRLSKTSATMGSLLKFKPILGLNEGLLEMYAKARGFHKALSKMIEIIQNEEMDIDEPVCIAYTGNHIDLSDFEEPLKETFHFEKVLHGVVGPVIGTHAGPGAKLIAYVVKERL